MTSGLGPLKENPKPAQILRQELLRRIVQSDILLWKWLVRGHLEKRHFLPLENRRVLGLMETSVSNNHTNLDSLSNKEKTTNGKHFSRLGSIPFYLSCLLKVSFLFCKTDLIILA